MKIDYKHKTPEPQKEPLESIQVGNGLRIDIGAGRMSIDRRPVERNRFTRVTLTTEFMRPSDGDVSRVYAPEELDDIAQAFKSAAKAQRELSE